MSRSSIRRRRSQGFTLIELLVVIFIVLLITSIAIPIMVPSMEERTARQTSRMVTAFIAGARSRAIETGRPFGVMLEPMHNGTTVTLAEACISLSYVEVQPPYAGDTLTSRAVISGGNVTGLIPNSDESTAAQLLHHGDLIKFNYQGHYYILGNIANVGNQLTSLPWALTRTDGGSDPPNSPSSGVPFQIFRQPVKTAAAPLQLPDAMVIDLTASGSAGIDGLYDPAYPTAHAPPYGLIFSPNGSLTTIFHASGSQGVTGPVFLLVGKREKVPAAVGQENWRDLTNFWVTIHHQTGLVAGTEIAAANTKQLSREFAYHGQSTGGR